MGKSRSVSRVFGWVSVRLGYKEDTSYGILMGITSPKTNGWRAPKSDILEKVDSGLKYGHFWYLCYISEV